MAATGVYLGRPLSVHQRMSDYDGYHGGNSGSSNHPHTSLMPTSSGEQSTAVGGTEEPEAESSRTTPVDHDPTAGHTLIPLPPASSGAHTRYHGRESTTSDSDRTIDAREDQRKRRSKELDEHEPSEKNMMKAGMIAGGTAVAGAAGREALLSSAGTRPTGWRDVQVPEKHHLWSSAIKNERKQATKKGAMVFGFITLWLWICLLIFWGSNYMLEPNFVNLTVNLIPFDTDAESFLVGPIVNQANYQNSEPRSSAHFTWVIKSPNDYPNGLEDVRRDIMGQKAWAAVVINANATSAWRTALANGDASYDPTGAIGVYYASARFYQVTLLYIESILTQSLMNPIASARGAALQSFAQTAAGNANAITLASRVPQAIGTGFGYTIFDLRPIGNGQWSSAAPMEAALIYFVIFAFYLALFQGMARMKSGLHKKLKFGSIVGLRLGWQVLAYFFVSLWFTCVERAWQVPLENHFGHGGFPILWALNFVTIIAAGLALETVQALLGIPGLPPFLILWIILNITSSFYPIELMPRFYRFLFWLPFINNVEGFKIIAFGTNFNHVLAKHFGILFGLIGVELIIFPLSIWFERWKLDKGLKKAEREKREKKEKEDSNQEGEGGEGRRQDV